MQDLASQRCFNHAQREAVARCPRCARFFCRECISDYDDQAICASCLRDLARVPVLQRRGWAGLVRFSQTALGLLVAWIFFYLVGEALLSLPTAFHERTLWRVNPKE